LRGAPHWAQKRISGRSCWPQYWQLAGVTFAPQYEQKAAPASTVRLQCWHVVVAALVGRPPARRHRRGAARAAAPAAPWLAVEQAADFAHDQAGKN
jgi:hypothetical protein